MLVSLIIAGLALSAAQAASPPPPAVPPPIVVTGQQPPAEQKKVCKWSGTGTIFPKRVCMTPDDWAKLETNAEGDLQRMREIQHGARCSDFRC